MSDLTPKDKSLLMQEFTEADKTIQGFLILEEFKNSFLVII